MTWLRICAATLLLVGLGIFAPLRSAPLIRRDIWQDPTKLFARPAVSHSRAIPTSRTEAFRPVNRLHLPYGWGRHGILARGKGFGAPKEDASDLDGWNKIRGFKTRYQVLEAGSEGAKVKKGRTVTVEATGVLQPDGQVFWSTKDPDQKPFTYQAGVGNVIAGWDQGCLGMQVGEKRRLVIPPEEGYGVRGLSAWGIPPQATLEFTLECIKIE
eukprot:gnl/TRDRNA2_/TRDRNA2_42260_c0_seq1.p1 gnl/TRDRNA2_/TRDRNA2_42260_c0~~gnl/TRDRNA2_/TRDRNA2_42260_c0_seq1.p1  ORF type:complete len:213 (+),score=27.29 gnl/TRDRNA2_/TRDRNA2_42260_c0_seq1:71-709(+)